MLSVALTLSFCTGALAAWPSDSSLIVTQAPKTVKPYVLPALNGFAFNFNGQVGRVIVSNESSAGAYTLLSFSSGLTAPGTVHLHLNRSESLYSASFPPPLPFSFHANHFPVTKGTINAWSNTIGRSGRQNDFQLLPPNNTHSFALTDPDSEAIVSFQPGGDESLLLALGAPYNTTTNTPFDPEVFVPINATAAVALAPKYGLVFKFADKLNMDFTNGTTPDGLGKWHVVNQTLPGSPLPYFLASNMGPKFLDRSTYHVVTPLATGAETSNGNTVSTIAIPRSTLPGLKRPAVQKFGSHQTFKVLEGQLTITISGQTVNLIAGDAVHIPAGTRFTYSSKVDWTRFYAYCGGVDCLAQSLLRTAEPWISPVFPGH